MGFTGAVDVDSAPTATEDLEESCAESCAIVAEVLVEETEETVEVIEEEDDTDVSELLPEFDSSCIVDKTRQVSMGLVKLLIFAGLQKCSAMPEKGWAGVSGPRGSWSRVGRQHRAEVTAAVESTVSEDDGNWWCRKVTVGYDRTRHENATQDKVRGNGQGAKATSLRVLVDLSVGDVAELVGFVDCLVE